MHEEPDWVSVDGNFEDEVWGRARLHRLPGHPVMEGVDQRLVKVQHKDLPLDNAQPVANGQRQVWSLSQFSWLFTKSVVLTNSQGLRKLFWMESWDLCA